MRMTTIVGFTPGQTLFLLTLWIIGTLIAGVIYSQIYKFRADRGTFDKPLNDWYKKSDVKRDIMAMEEKVAGLPATFQGQVKKELTTMEARMDQWAEGFQRLETNLNELPAAFDTKITESMKSLRLSILGQQGAMAKQLGDEERALMEDMADVQQIEYPALAEVHANLSDIEEAGLLPEGWSEKFGKLSKFPQALPHLEPIAQKILDRFNDNGHSKGSGGAFSWK